MSRAEFCGGHLSGTHVRWLLDMIMDLQPVIRTCTTSGDVVWYAAVIACQLQTQLDSALFMHATNNNSRICMVFWLCAVCSNWQCCGALRCAAVFTDLPRLCASQASRYGRYPWLQLLLHLEEYCHISTCIVPVQWCLYCCCSCITALRAALEQSRLAYVSTVTRTAEVEIVTPVCLSFDNKIVTSAG